jgi:CRISPR-associated endonuclease Cas2
MDGMVNRAVVVVYDVSDDRCRARVRAWLDGVADRFQRSGWVVPPGQKTAQVVIAELSALVQPGDRIRAYAPCTACARRARWLPSGQPHSLRRVPGWSAWS